MKKPNQPPSGQEQRGPTPAPWRGSGLWVFLLLGLVAILGYGNRLGWFGTADEISYTQFRAEVRHGHVREVVIGDKRIQGWRRPESARPGARPGARPTPPRHGEARAGRGSEPGPLEPDQLSMAGAATVAEGPERKPAPEFYVVRPTGLIEGDLIEFLADHEVAVRAEQPSQMPGMLWLLLLFGGTLALTMLLVRRANPAERAMAFGRSRARQYVEKDTKITFADVAGIDEPKEELEEIVEYLRSPDKFRRLGGRIPRGVLLVGAPGTGKTLLAKAVAGEAKVPFFSMSGSDFVELFVGVGASRVRDLFRQAEHHSPCIVFIDELDALGKVRGGSVVGGGHDEREQTLNQMLVEMDGFDSSANVIIMGATNRPEILDPALLRPGRFDRQVMIPAPDINGREQILRVHAAGKQISADVDLRRVAYRTPGFVGADLANVVNEAALLAARRNRDAVVFEDFDEAIDRVSVGLERKSHVMTEHEKRITAYHEAGHALVAVYCEHADPVHKISIIPRGFAGGYTQFLPQSDRRYLTERQLRDQLAVLLGGRVAEEIVFGDVSTGARNDIERVTDIARAMVTELGMSALGPVSYEARTKRDAYGMSQGSDGPPISEETARRIDEAVRAIVDEAYQQAQALLSDHRDQLETISLRLIEIEVMDREELYQHLGLPEPAEHQPDRFTLVEPAEEGGLA